MNNKFRVLSIMSFLCITLSLSGCKLNITKENLIYWIPLAIALLISAVVAGIIASKVGHLNGAAAVTSFLGTLGCGTMVIGLILIVLVSMFVGFAIPYNVKDVLHSVFGI